MNRVIIPGTIKVGRGSVFLLIVHSGCVLSYSMKKKTPTITEPIGSGDMSPEPEKTEPPRVPDGEERMATENERNEMNRLIEKAIADSTDRKT